MELLLIKTGALGDVLRTTSILPGLQQRFPGLRVHWLTATGAVPLLALNPRVHRVHGLDLTDPVGIEHLAVALSQHGFTRVLSFDDEPELCALATRVAGGDLDRILSGAYLDAAGQRRYTPDVGPWFDMGLLSIHGKQEADRLKLANTESHPAIFARMLGVEPGQPELFLSATAVGFGEDFAVRHRLHHHGPVIGLNTGAGGRWESKRLTVERTVELARELERRHAGRCTFLVLGGRDEAERNAAILAAGERALKEARMLDAGTDNALPEFAALVDRLDLLVTSDSLALHVAVARRRPVVAFFAPTSAAEIELYGRGRKVVSTAPDACSYRPDADTSTLTVERLADAVDEVLPSSV